MRQPAAKSGDQIVSGSLHTHFMIVPGSPSPVPREYPCTWQISKNLSPNVNIERQPAATEHSGGQHSGDQAHKVMPPATGFASAPPTMDQAEITKGSGSVKINGKAAARSGDACTTCHEPVGDSSGKVVSSCSVWIGD
jgi:uncharacterized Zn-binding protein involved in type VI secretion